MRPALAQYSPGDPAIHPLDARAKSVSGPAVPVALFRLPSFSRLHGLSGSNHARAVSSAYALPVSRTIVTSPASHDSGA